MQSILTVESYLTLKPRSLIRWSQVGSLVIGLAFSLLMAAEGGTSLQAAEPIPVGSIFSMTGWAGALGTPAKEAIEIVVDDVSRRGGVLGQQIEIAYEDDQSNPTNSAFAATKLIRDRKVSVLLGSTLTVFCMPIIPIAEREQVPMMAFGAGHEITYPLKKWIFHIPLTDYRLSPRMLSFTVNTLGL